MIRIGHRFMTGQVCNTSGCYAFDGYTGTSSHPILTEAERSITVIAGEAFPAASSEAKNAYWKFTGVG